ncbi:hypothetical protein LX32DRAFT_277368 [Colletotrichum zoysiae]|uniref:Uncharacterized protein n=1 Tax=Colletotrichum zoysiae TaxID=1216348 RepID=A0AAD9H406_9PEZI|nr:hypothetical protein LX32DRAFT_277368 [Colletotrichum zoysiae]
MHRTASEPYHLSKLSNECSDPDRSGQIPADSDRSSAAFVRLHSSIYLLALSSPPRRASLGSRRVPSRAFAQILASHFRGPHPILGVLIMFPPRLPNCSPDPFLGLSTPDRTRYLLRTANSNPLLPPLAHGGMHAGSVTTLDLRICLRECSSPLQHTCTNTPRCCLMMCSSRSVGSSLGERAELHAGARCLSRCSNPQPHLQPSDRAT